MIAKATLRLHVAGVLAAALALASCSPKGAADQNSLAASSTEALPPLPAALPLATGSATPIAAAPPVAALPRARQLDWGRPSQSGEDYAWIDRAYDMTDAIGDAPPDYAFDYDGVSPWAWQTSDDYVTYAEPIDDGYRYYYYEPGQNTPFLVRDPYYSYGYSGGRVVAVYDGGGRALSYDAARREADAASRYYARAEALRRAARVDNRRAVIAANWAARRDAVARARTELGRAEGRQPAWRDYRARSNGEQHWQAEQQRRAADARRFAAWQRDGFRGEPQVNRAADHRQAGVREAMQVQQAQALAEQQRAQAAARRGRADEIGADALALRDARARVQAERLAQERQGAANRRQQFDGQQREQAAAAQRQQGELRQQQARQQQQQQQQLREAQAVGQAQREATARQRGLDDQKRNQASVARATALSRQQQQQEAQGAARQRQALEAQRQQSRASALGQARAEQAARADAARATEGRAQAARAGAMRAEATRQQQVVRAEAARADASRAQAAQAGAARAEAARSRQEAVGQARAQQAQAAAQARAAQAQAAAGARQAQAAQARAAQAQAAAGARQAQAAQAQARAAQSRAPQQPRPARAGPKDGGGEKRHPGN